VHGKIIDKIAVVPS